MSDLGKKLKKKGVKVNRGRKTPLWKGPEEDGITQSLLSLFLVCRERFRLKVVEGLQIAEGFNHYLEYGQMWHVCEESFALSGNPIVNNPNGAPWEKALFKYSKSLCEKYPLQQEQIEKWYNVCKIQFPVYVKYWKQQPDVKKRVPIFQEQVFRVPYVLPSGRTVTLRGKWDGLDYIGVNPKGLYLQENKTKGQVVEHQLLNQLRFDLQTMMYIIALDTLQEYDRHGAPEGIDTEEIVPNPAHWGNLQRVTEPIRGIRYNVIRRPLSGGKGSIRPHKPTQKNPKGESMEEFYDRLRRDYLEKEPEYFFMRFTVNVSDEDIVRFKNRCLDPLLEMLCDWWEGISENPFDPWSIEGNSFHFQYPYGIYHVLNQGGTTDLDEYLDSGNEVGLERAETLFNELEEE